MLPALIKMNFLTPQYTRQASFDKRYCVILLPDDTSQVTYSYQSYQK